MILIIIKGFLRILVGVTIFTTVQTGIIGPDIPTFNTVAPLPHPLVFQLFKLDPVRLSQNI